MVPLAVRELLAEPRAADAPVRVWRDHALVAAVAVGCTLEVLLRSDVPWPAAAAVVSVILAPTVLWRRQRPLASAFVSFGVVLSMSIVVTAATGEPFGLYTWAVVIVNEYALYRWGSGREAAAGVPVLLVAWVVGISTDPGTVGDAIGGMAVLLVTAAGGRAVRYQAAAKQRELDQALLQERQELARELHDTVAHHVSAIAVQAQAGLAVASTRPDAAVEVLQVIEEAASRTLEEMRSIVGALRSGDDAALAPQRGVADIGRLAATSPDGVRIEVDLPGDLGRLRPSVDAALYRIAQESVTNALRHARHASTVSVRVTAVDDAIQLVVADDGLPVAGATPTGYGLLGMAERARLLGGVFAAGPSADRGWVVDTRIPRHGEAGRHDESPLRTGSVARGAVDGISEVRR